MLVDLPTGIVEGNDHFNRVEIDELRGKQQNYLANRELVEGNIGHIPKILHDMILSLQTKEGLEWQGKKSDIIWRLTSSDIETLLVKIREKTFGARYYLDPIECPKCQHPNDKLRLNLDELEIKQLSLDEIVKPKSTVLPSCGKEVVFKPLYLKDLMASVSIMRDHSDELITSILAFAIESLDGNPIKPKDLDDISVKDLNYMGEYLEKESLDGSIDTDVEVKCKKCKHKFTDKLNVLGVSFFVHTKGS